MQKNALEYDFVFRRVADRNGPTSADEVALGSLRVVHVERLENGRMKAVSMPAAVARSIQVAPRS